MYRTLVDEMVNFENILKSFNSQKRRMGYPVVNAYETDDELKLIAILPGVSPSDVEITFEKGVLNIKGEKKNDKQNDHKYLREERNYGEFSKSLMIPQDIDVNSIIANYKDGLLYITMKKQEYAKTKKIEIK